MRKLLLIILATALGTPAFATDLDWDWDINRRKAVRHHQHKRVAARRERESIRLYGNPQWEERREDGWRCLERIHVVGSQWVGDSGAEDSAKKAFMEEVRWRHGEAFMDVANARDYQKRCSRSSVGEAVGQTLVRCEISARPCRPPMKSEEGR